MLHDKGSVSVEDSADESDGSVGIASLEIAGSSSSSNMGGGSSSSPSAGRSEQLKTGDSPSAGRSEQLKTSDSGSECARGVAEGGRDSATQDASPFGASWVRLLGLLLPRLLPERESSFERVSRVCARERAYKV